MNEDTGYVFMILFWASVALVVYQRFFVIRGLRWKLDNHIQAALARSQPAPVPAPVASPDELRKVEERLKVLERIAVEKESTLTREIEDLRSADA